MGTSEEVAVGLERQVVQDAVADGLERGVVDLLIAALHSDDAVLGVLAGRPLSHPGDTPTPALTTGYYLTSIEVTGFRGIGRRTTLNLKPSPGLTLIVGRNGTAKSSFAEAAEIAVSGRSSRWADSSLVWKSGWRNMHEGTDPLVRVGVVDPGSGKSLLVACRWAPEAKVEDVQCSVEGAADAPQPLATLGWDAPLSMFRPFLSYAELGRAVGGRPSELYDQMNRILGLGLVDAASKRIEDLRKALEGNVKNVSAQKTLLVYSLKSVDDARAMRATDLLSKRATDLDALTALASGQGVPDPNLERWAAVASADFPSAEQVEQTQRVCAQAVLEVQGAESAANRAAERLAQILDLAAAHIEQVGPGPCPACGVTNLGADFPTRARLEAGRHRQAAEQLRAARGALESARQQVLQTIGSASSAEPFATLFPKVAAALTAWHQLSRGEELTRVAEQMVAAHAGLQAQMSEARQQARDWIQQHQDNWQPYALKLAQWIPSERQVRIEAPQLAQAKAADMWLRGEAQRLRDARMAPFSRASQDVWALLRQESSVDLGSVTLTGNKTQRKVNIPVSVDGVDGAALGVMSQGELHSLGLALFIPRATADQSPFRFVVIDDPVQAMDPAKVDGLAQVLHQVAQERQVIVFTHDLRLLDAARQLQIPARILEVVRRPNSAVDVRKLGDLVSRYLEDARALAHTQDIAPTIRGPVIAGFLRSAVEATAMDRARRRLLSEGLDRVAVDQSIAEAETTMDIVSLALYGSASDRARVMGELNRWNPDFADAFRRCREGVHQSEFERWTDRDFLDFVKAVERLTQRIA